MSIFQSQQTQLSLEKVQEEKKEEENTGVNYGNLIVFSRSRVHLSIGPDYPFTIAALVFLGLISFALYVFQGFLSFGVVGRVINFLFVLTPPASFIYTALSDPGLYNCYENNEPKVRYCEICRVFKPSKVYHCERCNVCIEGFDHHCPWLSKCVGRKNLLSFYVFIISLPASFLYFGYLIYTAISMQHQRP